MKRYMDLVGKEVVVTNPTVHTTWRGRAIGYADQPTLMLEMEDGFRLMLPAAWAKEALADETRVLLDLIESAATCQMGCGFVHSTDRVTVDRIKAAVAERRNAGGDS